ncbi:DinB family protein [Paenibacillus paeoniae]|uniref:DinB family protein n=1 Tax=Paenibacillus paeoniae TaxID=2292705 RepID=A0A371PIJ2_9BACL|nr:DinB family protein [Paenibacillus paeoniae]REK75190.1 DinB family protein [Paenibacillus paeoniae]
MENREQLVHEFKRLITFAEGLKSYSEAELSSPIAPGKWSPKEIMAHIMVWDQYYFEYAITPVAARQEKAVITSSDLIEVDSFNHNSMQIAKERAANELFELVIETRELFIQKLNQISEQSLRHSFVDADGTTFVIFDFVVGLIEHDQHHMDQIENLLTSNTSHLK